MFIGAQIDGSVKDSCYADDIGLGRNVLVSALVDRLRRIGERVIPLRRVRKERLILVVCQLIRARSPVCKARKDVPSRRLRV